MSYYTLVTYRRGWWKVKVNPRVFPLEIVMYILRFKKPAKENDNTRLQNIFLTQVFNLYKRRINPAFKMWINAEKPLKYQRVWLLHWLDKMYNA